MSKNHKPRRRDTLADGQPRDSKRAPRGPKSKTATVARRQARASKRAVQGR